MGRIRKRHSSAFKAKVALEAVKQDKTITELAKTYQVHPVQISQWKKQLLDGVPGASSTTARRPADPISRSSRSSCTSRSAASRWSWPG